MGCSLITSIGRTLLSNVSNFNDLFTFPWQQASSPTSPHPPAWMVKKMKENEWKRATNQLGSFFSSYSPLPDPFKRGQGRRQANQLSASVDGSSKVLNSGEIQLKLLIRIY